MLDSLLHSTIIRFTFALVVFNFLVVLFVLPFSHRNDFILILLILILTINQTFIGDLLLHLHQSGNRRCSIPLRVLSIPLHQRFKLRTIIESNGICKCMVPIINAYYINAGVVPRLPGCSSMK